MSDQPMTPEDEVRQMLDQGNPKSWKWDEDGPEVIGYAIRKETANTQEGPCDILVLKVKHDDGQYYERSIWLFHTALVSQLERKRPQVGDLVGIRSLGERTPQGGGRAYYDYNVVVYGAKGTELSWGQPSRGLPSGEEVAEAEVVEEERPASTNAYHDPYAEERRKLEELNQRQPAGQGPPPQDDAWV